MDIEVIDGNYCRTRHSPSVEGRPYSVPEGAVCWHCCHAIDDPDCSTPLPVDYDERRGVYRICGHFCSLACMTAHSKTARKMGYSRVGNGMYLFKFIKDHFGIIHPSEIPMAPPREMLNAFGGNMTIEEFRQASEKYTYTNLPQKCVMYEELVLQKRREHVRMMKSSDDRTMRKRRRGCETLDRPCLQILVIIQKL